MSVLNRIAASARARVAALQAAVPLAQLQASLPETRKPHDFAAAFRAPGYQVIAEIKLASPSKGPIAPGLDPVAVAGDYLAHGAAALSVLTEPEFFKGDTAYLSAVRQAHPEALLLQKDFVVDAYQLYQARVLGADACLLIVAMLTAAELQELYRLAVELELTPLVEVHTAQELEQAAGLDARLIGVNNRDLKTLTTDLDIARRLAGLAPPAAQLICESGLSSGADLRLARSWGYRGFLIGTHLMATGEPGQALKRLLEEANDAPA
ncbi:MAG TPA: indole-3-glycerol phosphate synthase TrpC [Candidatus Obscuribacterales bacterium]